MKVSINNSPCCIFNNQNCHQVDQYCIFNNQKEKEHGERIMV